MNLRFRLKFETFINVERYLQLAYLKCRPSENVDFEFITDRYTITFREPVYESEIQTKL